MRLQHPQFGDDAADEAPRLNTIDVEVGNFGVDRRATSRPPREIPTVHVAGVALLHQTARIRQQSGCLEGRVADPPVRIDGTPAVAGVEHIHVM